MKEDWHNDPWDEHQAHSGRDVQIGLCLIRNLPQSDSIHSGRARWQAEVEHEAFGYADPHTALTYPGEDSQYRELVEAFPVEEIR